MNKLELIRHIASHLEFTNVVIGDEGDRTPMEAIQRIASEPETEISYYVTNDPVEEPTTLLVYTKPAKTTAIFTPKVAVGEPCNVKTNIGVTPHIFKGEVVEITHLYRVRLNYEGVQQLGVKHLTVSDGQIEPLNP